MISFLSQSNNSFSGILYCLLLINHIGWKSIEQRITVVQFRGFVGMNQNFSSVLAYVSSNLTYVL